MPMKQQTFDSAGPDIRVRGNAYQVWEKYLGLARDAQTAGDRIAAENFFQHAEHYYRIMNANGGDPASYNGRPRYRDENGFDEEQPGGQPAPEQRQGEAPRPGPGDLRQPDARPDGRQEGRQSEVRPRDLRSRPQNDGGQGAQPAANGTANGGSGSDEPTGGTGA